MRESSEAVPIVDRVLIVAEDKGTIALNSWGVGREVCLCIHGFGDGAYVWEKFGPPAAQLFRFLALDLRGHGDSSWDPTGEYDISQHVADVRKVISNLELDRLVLVGHSLGAQVAIRVAAELKTCLVGVVIVDFAPGVKSESVSRVSKDFNESIKTYGAISEYAAWLRLRRPLLIKSEAEHIASKALREDPSGGFRIKCDPSIGRRSLDGDDADLWQMLRSISVPVLVVRGIGSAVLPHDVAITMKSALQQGSLQTVDFAGHAVMTDNPDGFWNALYLFLRKIRMGPPEATSELDRGR